MGATTADKFVYVTGHCGNGAHEGTKILSPRGTLLTPCSGEYKYRFCVIICKCFCHSMIAMIRSEDPDALTLPDTNPPIDNAPVSGDSSVSTQASGGLLFPLIVPTDQHKVYRLLLAGDTVAAQLANFVRVNVLKTEPTESQKEAAADRRKRGELEANVELVCKLWLDKHLVAVDELTTNWIALLIDASEPPSQGAIHAVLTRWADHGYAKIEHKPFRFVEFIGSASENGIAAARFAYEREKDRRAKGFW